MRVLYLLSIRISDCDFVAKKNIVNFTTGFEFLGKNDKIKILYRPGGGIGLHARLKIVWPQGLEGSSPSLGTRIEIIYYLWNKH